MYYILTYFAGSFGRYNVHTKVFYCLITIYPIITALTGFQFSNLLPYLLQVVPTASGWNVYWAAVNGELKTTLVLKAYHKHLKANFGLHPKINKFFSLLQHKQEKTISKLCDLSNRVPPTKPTTCCTLFTKAIQGAAKH
ncbi:hypothetical protein DSO57_1013704 [Entomophthora muscae]|uniref:Uncharacterized protein n=1 Tax=Entomophthora muscae TaxID=34485 RepID=A0ACC2TG39_9FUNG|nr:hypothetical protein DSO57_1013704 [Entomophthora muscae]